MLLPKDCVFAENVAPNDTDTKPMTMPNKNCPRNTHQYCERELTPLKSPARKKKSLIAGQKPVSFSMVSRLRF